jgi:hypothetical protein
MSLVAKRINGLSFLTIRLFVLVRTHGGGRR